MRTDSPAGIMGALGLIEDDMEEMLHEYAAAAGWMASWEKRHRRLYLETRETMIAMQTWEPKTTETQKKDDIEFAMLKAHAEEYATLERMARQKAIGDKLFAGLDARRSIGQTLMKAHVAAADPKYGQAAQPQSDAP